MSIFAFSVLLLAAIIITTAAFCYLIFGERVSSSKSLPSSVGSMPTQMIVADRFLILDHQTLIEVLNLQPQLAAIQRNLGLSIENWKKDALPFLYSYIEFVQRLPASESHHHAGDGGLIKHTLDVASMALAASTAQSWPPNAKTEDIAQKTPAWRYGIMCAAILHDIGKTITGFEIELYADATSHEKSHWLPDTGSMVQSSQKYYRVLFPTEKTDYSVHAKLGWTFFPTIVPQHVMQWLAQSDPNLIIALRDYLSGQKDKSPFQKIITDADMASVARDLKHGSRQRFASAKRTPLIETIMDTLQEMLAERGAYFSVATTAGGDLFRQGDVAYMMAKNVPDRIRTYLKDNQSRAAASFPADNQRIFDTLLEYGAVIPAPNESHKAVMNIDVTFTRSDGESRQNHFSVLCFHLKTLFPNENYPAEFQGTLTVGTANNQTIPPKSETTPATDKSILIEATATETQVTPQVPTDIEETAPQTQLVETIGGIDELLGKLELPAEHSQKESETVSPPAESVNLETIPKDSPLKIPNRPAPEKWKRSSTKSNQSLMNELFKSNDKQVESAQQSANTKFTNEHLPENESAAAGLKEIVQQRESAPATTPSPVFVYQAPNALENLPPMDLLNDTADNAENTPDVVDPKDNPSITVAHDLRTYGVQFLQWLADNLGTGKISVNRNDSPVHFIEQGMLLVSPAIFRLYAGGVFDKNDINSFGVLAQRGFERLNLHSKDKTLRTSIFRAITKTNSDGECKKLFYCYLIPESNLHHIIQPASRPHNNTDITLHHLQDLLKMESRT